MSVTSTSPLNFWDKTSEKSVVSDLDLLMHIQTSVRTDGEHPHTSFWSYSENMRANSGTVCIQNHLGFSPETEISQEKAFPVSWYIIIWPCRAGNIPQEVYLSAFQHCCFWPARGNTETIGKGKSTGRESCLNTFETLVVSDTAFVRQSLS